VLANLRAGGPVCQRAAEYIARHDVRIGFAKQGTGARWTLDGRIELNPRYYPPDISPADPRLLGAIVHEATHLEQGPALALSVEGEVEGWRAELEARAELGDPIPGTYWQRLTSIPGPPTDQDLREARAEMLRVAGRRYLIWLLPLRPNGLTRFLERVGRGMGRWR
jgi:hypothetical protein